MTDVPLPWLEKSEQRLQSLLRVISSLTQASSPNDVYDVVLGEALSSLGARSGAVTLLQGEMLELVASRGYEAKAVKVFQTIPASAHYPVADVVRSQNAFYFHTAAERAERYPELRPYFHAATVASAYLPLLSEGRALGALTLSFPDEQSFDENFRTLMTGLAQLCSQALRVLERRQVEAALRDSEARFRTLAEAAPGFVWMDSEGGTNLYMNPLWTSFTGQSVEEARAGGWREATHPDDLARVAKRWDWSRRTLEPYEMELRHRHKDGSYHWFLAKGLPVKDAAGQVTQWVGTSTDIQSQKEALEALRESEAQFRELANSLPQIVWTSSPNQGGGLTFINQNWLDYTGQSLEQSLQGGTNEALHAGDLERTLKLWEVARTQGSVYEDEVRLRGRDGSYRWFLARAIPVKDERGQVTRWVGTSTDIHERKQQEFDAGFLLLLATRLGQLRTAADIEETLTRLLGDYLEVDSCFNAQVVADTLHVQTDWHRPHAKSSQGSYPFKDFVLPSLTESLKTSQTLVVQDVRGDARFAPSAQTTTPPAFIVVPRLEGGNVVGLMGVASLQPRIWQTSEIQLVENVARQLWPAVNKAKAEETLRQSEERYRTLFTSIDEGFCIIELLFDEAGQPYDYRFVEVNPMFESLTGLKDATGKTAKELVPDLEPHWFEIYGRVALTGESIRFVDESQAMDGRWFEVYAARIGGAQSRRVAIVFNNITLRKRTEDALRDSEEKLRMVLESASEYAILTTDLEGRVTSWNAGAERLLGYSEREILGHDTGLIFTPEDRAAGVVQKEMETALVTGRCADNRWHLKKDGTRFWATGTLMLLRDTTGHLQGFLKIMRDRSDERKAEAALFESEARLALTLQAGNLGIWDSDLENKQTYWSSEQEKLFGLEPGSFDGEFSKHVHPEDRMRVLRKIAQVKATGEDYEDEFRILRPDGSVRWLAGKGRVIRDNAGQAVRLIGVNFDITERKQRELNSNFLLDLNKRVRVLSQADDIEETVLKALGAYLQVNNCNFSRVDIDKDLLETRYNYSQGTSLKLEGSYKLSDYIPPEFVSGYKQGDSMAIPDIGQDPRTKPLLENIEALGIRSLIVVPYLKEGRWVGALNLSCAQPRPWRKDEIELAETVVAQFIPAIERARTESVATLLGERFRLTETSAKSFLYEWDVAAKTVWRSEGFEAVMGFHPNEVPHDSDWWNTRIHPEDYERTRERLETIFETGGEYSVEYRARRKDGAYLYLWDRGHVLVDEQGNTKQLLGTSTDITQQKRLELELAEAAARLDATIAFLPLGFCLLSNDYRYIRINSVLAEINGLSVEEHLGRRVPEILPYVWKMIEPYLKQIELTGEPVLNIEVKHPVDERTWLVSYYPVPDSEGGLLGFGSVALEISERQKTLNALRETNVRLRDLTERQQRFVADAAHELRAPLTSIRGNLDLLTRYQGIPEDEQQEMLGDLHQEALRLSALVEDLLELARSDSGLKMKKERVNLTEILLSAWHKAQAFNTSHTFELENLPKVELTGDADRLKQLVLILLENAGKYTPEGGTICMGLSEDKSEVLFYVRDTGIGIAREDLEHVFERFYRADKARTRAQDPGGTGLGLSIAEWIVNGHGGKIWLESDLGRGTTAFVRLPLSQP